MARDLDGELARLSRKVRARSAAKYPDASPGARAAPSLAARLLQAWRAIGARLRPKG